MPQQTASFENPMYNDTQTTETYADAQFVGQTTQAMHEQSQSTGYMDIPAAAGSQEQHSNTGYMDVTPTVHDDTTGYMDVAAGAWILKHVWLKIWTVSVAVRSW